MSIESQLIIKIIQYGSLFGLFISGLLSLFLINKKKKLLFVFLSFLFFGILSFVFYAGILFFTAGITIIFFFILLYLLVFQIELSGKEEVLNRNKNHDNNNTAGIILNIILPILFCGFMGYLIYGCTSDFLI